MTVSCDFASTTTVLEEEGVWHVPAVPQSWDGGQAPHVPLQPSSPHTLLAQLGWQLGGGMPELLDDPPVPLLEELMLPPPDDVLNDPLLAVPAPPVDWPIVPGLPLQAARETIATQNVGMRIGPSFLGESMLARARPPSQRVSWGEWRPFR
jgi:hypothetical protein